MFIGPFEHHSNELAWRESIADVVVIPEDADGHIDLGVLEVRLHEYRDRQLKIGSFSAASNVTGIVTDTRAVADLLHRHNALSFWDYAAAAPYVTIDMYDGHKDAVFISPHKFVGGPSTPGVLVVRRELLRNRVPTVPGGGTVDYVNAAEHHYISDPAHREEGGTPGDRRVDPRRPGVPVEGRGRRRRDQGARAAVPARRPSTRGRRIRTSRSSATSTPNGCRSCRSWCAARAGSTCTTTSW